MADARKTEQIHENLRRCGDTGGPNDMLLSELMLPSTDYAALMAARYFFSSLAKPSDAAWLNVFLCSHKFFPNQNNSAQVAQSVLAVVQEIRTSRRSTLRFSNPNCLDCSNFVTDEERHLVLMLRDTRFGSFSSARTHAMLLCEGNNIDALLQAVGQLVSDLLDLKLLH